MKNAQTPLIEDLLGVLVRRFGLEQVETALNSMRPTPRTAAKRSPKLQRPSQPTTIDLLGQVRKREPEKYRMLNDFYFRVRENEILRDTQDIRLFANSVGIKEIHGKSRKEILPKLMRILVEIPVERLRAPIRSAGDISQQRREQGYSVLTDKLLSKP